MTEHQRMLKLLSQNKQALATALNLDPQKIWIRYTEYPFDNQSEEKADMIFHDKFSPYKADPNTICFIVELKSDCIDHEVLGQIHKTFDPLSKRGKATSQWGPVKGVAIAPKFTKSALTLLTNSGITCLLWTELDNNLSLKIPSL